MQFLVSDGEDTDTAEGHWEATLDQTTVREWSRRQATDTLRDWRENAPAPRFCPWCGTALPRMRRKADRDPDICRVNDGGYYCATCGDRLNVCDCLYPSAAFEPVPE